MNFHKTLFQSCLTPAKAEQAATNQQFPNFPWNTSPELIPASNSFGSEQISYNLKEKY